MGPGVIADEMAAFGDLASESGLIAGIAADEEECRFDAVAFEDFEKARGEGWVGSVVECEGDFARLARCCERAAENLRCGPEGCVVVAADGEAGGCNSHRS